MKIEVHPCVHQKSQARNQSACMIGKISRISLAIENFPGEPKKQDQKNEPAKSTDRACFGKCFRVVVMGMIHDETVVIRLVKRKHLLQSAQPGSDHAVILKNPHRI